ncbi:bacterial regulatory protein, tetR family protein [Asticcacaulis biprosthecium C19]|uniref:Bacterial regulatory protein, tetR family protein n=1 Tax=Asticcacaulis biprosthecium C19 TaxID=715226 RepID=F4QGF5_9CAUL|nr:bacterial regulatory protein, tetR family protein [Asticcacaulis biprosthecium C19]
MQNPAPPPGQPPTKRGRPVNEALVPQILQIAGELFLDHGYQGTTMDAVARAVGMSKLTLYKRFASKEELFSAIVRDKCNQFIPDVLFEKLDGMPVREALIAMGGGLLRLLNSREAMTIEVMLRSEGGQTLRDLFFCRRPGSHEGGHERLFRPAEVARTTECRRPDDGLPPVLGPVQGFGHPHALRPPGVATGFGRRDRHLCPHRRGLLPQGLLRLDHDKSRKVVTGITLQGL